MENENKLTWGNLRFEIKMLLILLPIVIVGMFFLGQRNESLKNARFSYLFPQGMKPIAITRDYDGIDDDVWLCETEAGAYVECSPVAIIDSVED